MIKIGLNWGLISVLTTSDALPNPYPKISKIHIGLSISEVHMFVRHTFRISLLFTSPQHACLF